MAFFCHLELLLVRPLLVFFFSAFLRAPCLAASLSHRLFISFYTLSTLGFSPARSRAVGLSFSPFKLHFLCFRARGYSRILQRAFVFFVPGCAEAHGGWKLSRSLLVILETRPI
ncbi:hypothetical protein TSAR_013698 [Trichomalopsis sarcophagae]|uniref:Uncharacterized protein n=1 Tax=Trichomalopsis sarcophagae TaxID=543379 RepID=A0A232EJY4_9HYME|nr:hypothetical protein TSAR_013698 [Trichomalopsis sarcophagae]